jgi:hypothetical protein
MSKSLRVYNGSKIILVKFGKLSTSNLITRAKRKEKLINMRNIS